ncbi:hypothetical protein Btru_067275 [Bulinus truncatus]|nr:hypothetical protein Btru_067275 [Bulinus truncatus]
MSKVTSKDDSVYFEYEELPVHGVDETLVVESEEADLHKHFQHCPKNPGHTEFIPFEHFTQDKLPSNYQEENLFEFINNLAAVTVKLEVKMTSTDRPQFWPNSKYPFPNYSLRGKPNMRVGTGRVWRVSPQFHRPEESGVSNYCTCMKCKSWGNPSEVWWLIQIMTARHVVFDETEAVKTKCLLFYDRNNSKPTVLYGDAVSNENINIEEDCCYLSCKTCDMDLADMMEHRIYRIESLMLELHRKYSSLRNDGRRVIIVSHPHGCPKQISIGRWIQNYRVTDYIWKYSYTTSTCPGSSGATVYILGYQDKWMHHVHCGQLHSSNGEVNYSGAGLEPI